MLYPEILNKNQLSVANKLDFGKKHGVYLAGGTALIITTFLWNFKKTSKISR